jgi:hypothetical protein
MSLPHPPRPPPPPLAQEMEPEVDRVVKAAVKGLEGHKRKLDSRAAGWQAWAGTEALHKMDQTNADKIGKALQVGWHRHTPGGEGVRGAQWSWGRENHTGGSSRQVA